MKIALQNVKDGRRKMQVFQSHTHVRDWQKVLSIFHKSDQTSKLRSDLKEAFEQVALLRKAKGKKQNLSEFLNEL